VTPLLDDIRRAYDARVLLHEDPGLDTYRLFHGYSEGLPGLEIDRYGDTAILTSKGADTGHFQEVADCLGVLGNFGTIVGKERGKELQALRGELPSEAQVVREAGLRYSVEAWAPLNPGLYLDARPARAWLRENSRDHHVLNLFSFAGSLGVAAMAGGAASVTHVDTQKRALKRCAANHALNSQRVDHRDLVCEDVLRYLAKAAGGRRRYGGAIVDPPPRREGSTQTGALSPAALAAKLAGVVEPGGWILCFFHHDERSWAELEAGVCEAVGRPLRVCWRGRSGSDFPEADERRALRLSSFGV
jgi:23S rRNA (cytosine1962-C5)-methyltransferase